MEKLVSSDEMSSEPGRCIICLKKSDLKFGNERGDPDDQRDKDQDSREPEVSPLKSVVSSSGFLKTFRGIWEILTNKKTDDSNDHGISLETVISEGLVNLNGVFPDSEALSFCKFCCEKVLAVENLMKAVRQQVREIRMLLEDSRRQRNRNRSKGSGCSEREVVHEIKIEQGDDAFSEDEMEFEEDLQNSLEDQDQGPDDPSGEEDGKIWEWNDDNEDDPDYIKSEPEVDSDGDDEEEELKLGCKEDLEEALVTLANKQTILSSIPIPKDPLQLEPCSSETWQMTSFETSTKSEQRSFERVLTCDVPGCTRTFDKVLYLSVHKLQCHPNYIQPKKPKKAESRNPFPCDLEHCTKSFLTEDSLHRHKMAMHLKKISELERMDPQNKFPCSCGRSFRTKVQRYSHQIRNKTAHPNFELKFKTPRSMVGGQSCDLCGELVKLSNILEHLACHLGGADEYVVRCPNFEKCGHAFTHSKDFHEKHIQRRKFKKCNEICESIKFGFKCETCGYTTDQRIRLATHVDNEHERGTMEKKLKCPISGCGKMFAVKQSIFLHLHAHRCRRITSQKCDKCGEDVKIEEIEGHLKDKHGLKEIFGCEHCPLRFLGREEMVEHLWVHKDSGLSCDICGEGDDKKKVKYLKYGDFREHYFGEHKLCPKKFKCGDCDKMFWRVNEMNRHKIQNHSGGDEGGESKWKKKKKECGICGTSYGSGVQLMSHRIRVHGEEPFKCDICGETFHDKTKFNKHKREHAGAEFQKEWKCEGEGGCGKIFGDKNNFKRHLEVGHGGGEKRFVCEECGKGYCDAGGLKTHRDSVHLGLRPCVCEECGERFASGTVLKRHKLIHTGERPFGCEVCGQRFRHKEVLRRHKVGHEEKGAGFKPNGPMKQIRKRKGQ